MCRRKRLIAFIALILSCIMPVICVGAASNTYKSYFSHAGISDAEGTEFMQKCIVMRVGSCEGYIDNKRVYLFEGNKAVRAIKNDDICVPIRFVLKGLGVDFEKNDNSLTFEYDDRSITLSDGDSDGCFIYEGQLYASTETVSSILELDLHIENELVFMSAVHGCFDEGIPAAVMSELDRYLNYEWQYLNMGKALGYITGVYVHPKNPDIMYATGDVCGMFRWDTETETWLDCNRDSFEFANCNFTNSMGSIALDPSNENVIYAVFGNDSVDRGSEGESIDIFKSEDYGDSWTRCFFGKQMCAYSGRTRWATAQMAVDPNNPDIIYAGTRFDGLWKSEKGAKAGSWSAVNGIPKGPLKDELADSSGVAAIVFDPKAPVINGRTSVMYVSVLGYGVYKSTDCGETFTLMPGSPKIGAMCMRFINGHIYMAGASSKLPEELKTKYDILPGVFKYDGKTWSNITPTKSEPWYNSIAVNPENENELFVFREGWAAGGMNSRSLDGGKTWEKFPHWNDSICMGTALFAKYNGENVIYLPYGAGMYRLSDLNGRIDEVKAEEVSEGFDLLCIFSMRSVPSKNAPQLLMAVADFGQYAINDFYSGGHRVTGWQQNSFGMAYCNCDPSIVINGGSQTQKGGKGYIELSTDYGNTYTKLEGWNSANAPVSLAISSSKQKNGYPVFMAYAATGQKGIHRSTDMGKTWEYVLPLTAGEGTANGRALAADSVDGKTFYMLLANGTFYTTTDGGESWRIAHTFSGLTTWPQTTKAVPNVEKAVWVNGRKDGIYTTADGGYTWNKLPDVSFCYAFGFGKSKAGEKTPTAYMYGIYSGRESVYMSDNLGKTWKDIGNPGTNPGWCSDIEGDANVYGRVYIGCKSLLCGQIAGTPNDDGIPVISLDNQKTQYSTDRVSADRRYKVSGRISKKAVVTVNGVSADVAGDNSFAGYAELENGDNVITIDAVDETGQRAKTMILNVTYDPTYIGVGIVGEACVKTKADSYTVKGVVSEPCKVMCNDTVIDVGESKSFTLNLPLDMGENVFTVTAYDCDGNVSAPTVFTVERDEVPPVLTFAQDIKTSTTDDMFVIEGTLNESGEVRINGKDVRMNGSRFKKLLPLTQGNNSVYIQARDSMLNVMKPIELTINKEPKTPMGEIPVSYADDDFMSNFKLDGKIDEWQPCYELQKIVDDPNCTAKFDLRWDEKQLYIAVRVEDDILSSSAAQAYNNDAVEIYLDGDNSKSEEKDSFDKQCIYQWDGASGTTEYRSVKTDYGYSMEIVIPWNIINTVAVQNSLIGFDIDVCDNDTDDGKRNGVLIFSGDANNYKNTSLYATLKLIR